MNTIATTAGFIAILGRPNVGKSTLLNCILGKKISITSHKPQTTRHKILGIKSIGTSQAIYVDTPGVHRKAERKLNHLMNQAALSTITDVDVIVFMVAALEWREDDELVLKAIRKATCPVILVVNKVDTVQKELLLAYIQRLSAKREFATIIPVSAAKNINIAALEQEIQKLLPANPFFFSPEQITDRSEGFQAAEVIREKLMRNLGQEVPYGLSVMVDQLSQEEKILRINAAIVVERHSHKVIVIGKKGAMLKKIGTQARHELERLFAQKVFLQLWVKVKSGWADDERSLQQFGYET